MCLANHCNRGFYQGILAPENANASIVGDLEIGSDVCIPCDELCEQCTGPGSRIQPSSCQICKFATQGPQCVRACNNESGKEF